ncbi:MAG: ABC transporter permease [Gemmatimonadaceae bacterium]
MPDRGIRAGVRRLFRLPLASDANARADADDELASFLDARIESLTARGMTPPEATAEALLRLGGGETLQQVRDRLYHSATHREKRMRLHELLMDVRNDLRFGVRQLVKEPVFAVVAILTLALGIGANTAIFTVVDTVLLRTLPVPNADRLVEIGDPAAVNGDMRGGQMARVLSLPLYKDLRANSHHIVAGLAASGTAGQLYVRIGAKNEFEHPTGRYVSGNYFNVLGVTAERGRVFGDGEDGPPGSSPAVVISDAYWRRRFGGAANIVGSDIDFDGARLTVVGVARPGFTGDISELSTDIWLPINMKTVIQPHDGLIDDRGTSWLLLLGRLAPGVTLARARTEFTSLMRTSLVANSQSPGEAEQFRHEPISVTSGASGFSAVRHTFHAALLTLQVGVALLLLIVCTNIANLLLARAVKRAPEMSLRLALGAHRTRIVRQLMTESAIVAILGAVAGLGFAWWGGQALVASATDGSGIASATIDLKVLAFTVAVAILAMLGFGLAPALRASGVNLAAPIQSAGRTLVSSGRGGRIPIGRVLVPMQVALSLVLLMGTALLTRSLRNVDNGDPGLDRDHILTVDVDVAQRGVKGDRFFALARDISTRIANLPGVQAVTYSQNGLFRANDSNALVTVPGFAGQSHEDSTLRYDLVGPGYVRGIGGRLLRGRDIGSNDDAHAPSVAVVNETMERFYFKGQSAVGKVFYFEPGVPTTIVGVASDVRDHSLTGPQRRRAYAPYAQQLDAADQPALTLEIRTTGDPSLLSKSVKAAIASVDANLPLVGVAPLSQRMHDSISEQRLVVVLAIGFGFAALLLAAVGLYGVMSCSVAMRTSEIGLRSALGAQQRDLLGLVLRDGLRLVAFGIAAGVPLALIAARALGSQLHGVPATDPVSMAVALAVLLVCAIAASFIPALRASRIPPAVALGRGR